MPDFQVNSAREKDPDCLVLSLVGNLDLFSFGSFKSTLEQVADEKFLLVDLSAVPYIASSGWSVLMARARTLKNQNGILVAFGLNDGNQKVYETLQVDALLPVAKDLAEAKARLAKR